MNRKPETAVEIIDECDEFLDNFSNEETINIDRLNIALGSVYAEDEKNREILRKLTNLTSDLIAQKENLIKTREITLIDNTKILELLKLFLDNNFLNKVEVDDESYCFQCDKVARTFEGFFDETYVTFDKYERNLVVKLVTTNLKKKFKELLDKNKVLVMMSGTIHSEKVLKEIFGIQDYKIIEAETKMPGKIYVQETGFEVNCSFSNFSSGRVSRGQYLLALSDSIKKAKHPVLVHVKSFNDLPTVEELESYDLNIMEREKFREMQKKDSVGEEIRKFKAGETDILYSTKCSRGIDFPGETCNSIILTKYPYPDINSLFWKVLRQTRPQHYSDFYMDKSRREFLQKIYRGLRSESDHIFLLSPDSRIFDNFKRDF
jgi:Rad3-related DNA helicase